MVQAHAAASPTFPMLIGISGKRNFDGQNAGTDETLANSVEDRMSRLFKAIECRFPHTPKVVVTGAAFGTDLIAADAALRMGDNWAVAAILPFERALFEEDFDVPAKKAGNADWRARHARHAGTFLRILGPAGTPNPRVLVRELPKLRDRNGNVATLDALTRKNPHRDETLRRNHYEQVGQFIAEISTIMIAVMGPAEQPETKEADGGTARVAAYRRAGRPDEVGAGVARRSDLLRSEWSELMSPPARYLWLMDPAAVEDRRRYPVTALPPLTVRSTKCVYGGQPGLDLDPEPHAYMGPIRWLADRIRAGAASVGVIDAERLVRSRRLRASLVLAGGLERYNDKRSSVLGPPQARVAVDLRGGRAAVDEIHIARRAISDRQGIAKNTSTRAFYGLAGFFLLAVFAFEIFAKFFPASPYWLGFYLGFLSLIGVLSTLARVRMWQPVAEDYRAVAEMLRVQRAWWEAGLTHRVDWEHLEGAAQDLAPIREAAKTVIVWTLLRCGWPDPDGSVNWIHVRGNEPDARPLRGGATPSDWIGSQLWYFTNKVEDRDKDVQAVDAWSWSLFVASGALGAVLWSWFAFHKVEAWFDETAASLSFRLDGHSVGWVLILVAAIDAWILHRSFRNRRVAELLMITVGVLAGIAVAFDARPFAWFLIGLGVIGFRALNRDLHKGTFAAVLTLVLSLVAAVAAAFMLVSAHDWIVAATGPNPHAVPHAIVALLVFMTACAGALRYLVERLNIEAEALDYRDARGRFERAEQLLAEGADAETGTPADQKKARDLVHELGRLALEENEAWLKSRRERPLTPVVG